MPSTAAVPPPPGPKVLAAAQAAQGTGSALPAVTPMTQATP